MTEKAILWTTGALGDGLTKYTMAETTRMYRHMINGGIYPGYANELAPTGAAPNVNIDTGAACHYGYDYDNDASVAVNIPTPVGATRIDRIVLRASWAAQTVRITRIAGVEGGAAPAITQTPNVTWDEKICQVSITTGGVITVTNERNFAKFRDQSRLRGEITMWAGTLSGHYPVDPKTGVADTRWHICNGDTEAGVVTPNLADKFIVAAGPTYAAGSTGGAATHTHPVGTLAAATEAAHTHGIGSIAAANESAHTHAYGTLANASVQAGNHNHNINLTTSVTMNFNNVPPFTVGHTEFLEHQHTVSGLSDSTNPAAHTHGISGSVAAGSAHTHTMSGTSAAGAAHTHTLSGSTDSGSTLPPYYSLVHICYVGS